MRGLIIEAMKAVAVWCIAITLMVAAGHWLFFGPRIRPRSELV